ncbi:MAG: isocitrate lyase/phosphoenolpyruvate mutase family protein [Vicinamibacterales bacterium]
MPTEPVSSIADRRARFRALHAAGTFVIPNPWDVGSARILASMGFAALASTSSGFAWSTGRRDNHITLDDALAHLTQLVGAVDLPINADFEGGFAVAPDAVAANVARAVDTGIAGVSIEDSTGQADAPLFDSGLAVERIAAAREAIEASRTGTMLVARSEGFIAGRPDLDETIRRLRAFSDAGADCLYAPGIRSREQIAAVVQAVAPKPVNVLVSAPFITVAELADLGVRRVSVGGALARAAWGGFLTAAREIAEHGTFSALGRGVPSPEMNGLFRG